MKELFIAAHEELVAEYLEQYPETCWSNAYELTADAVWDRYREKLADMIDAEKTRAKYAKVKP